MERNFVVVDEERLRRAFRLVSQEIRHLKHRQQRIEKLVLKSLRDFKKLFTVNLN
jgi:hypothetical protein